MDYKVITSRSDVPEELYTVFEATNDNEAREHFEKYKKNPTLQWDTVRLLRIDRPAVKELTTEIDSCR